ncbi:MAG: ABC transporter permease, partial [Bacteroidota bacterium]
MLKNYLKIALRKIRTQKFYAITNILGLTIGISCCLLITLLVLDEISYDSHNERADDIYRVAGAVKLNGVLDEYAYSPALLADAMKAEIPEVENTVRFRSYGPRLLRKEGTIQNFRETRVTHVDAALFEVFTLPLIYGDQDKVLQSPNGIVLTQSMAEKYFGKANPIGESMILDDAESYRVDGVCIDMPSNSHFHYDAFLPTVGLEEFENSIWLSNNAYT